MQQHQAKDVDIFAVDVAHTVGVGVLNHRINRASLYTSALDQSQKNNDNRDDQQEMNESAHRVGRDQAKDPEDDQEDCNSFQHFSLS